MGNYGTHELARLVEIFAKIRTRSQRKLRDPGLKSSSPDIGRDYVEQTQGQRALLKEGQLVRI